MNKITLLISLMVVSNAIFAQITKPDSTENSIKIQISADIYTDIWMQWERYLYEGKDYYSPNENEMIEGITIELFKPSKIKNLNYMLGTSLIRYNNNYTSTVGSFNENQLTGAGLYTGIEFAPKCRTIGFSIKMAVGYFQFSRIILQSSSNPLDHEGIEKYFSSGSLGSILQAGLNYKLGRFSIHPSGKLLFCGGNQMSVIAPGVSLGVGYTFR